MKKRIALVFAIVSVIVANAANLEKRYTKLIEKYDVPVEAREMKDSTSTAFWAVAVDENELYLKFLREMKKNKGAEKEALRKTAELPRFYPRYEESIVEDMQGYCDSLLTDMGITALGKKCRLYLVYSDQPDTFTALTDDGFAICVTTGLFCRKGMTRDILKGYVAREFVHGALQDHCRSFYQEAKDERKSKLVGSVVAVGIVGLAVAAEAVNPDPYYDYPVVNNEVTVVNNIDIQDEVKLLPSKYFFKYTPDLEYQADLIAFRFMQRLGMEGDYINGLKILGASYDSQFGANTDQPTILQRIAFLDFVDAHPELYNTENFKLQIKRLRSEKK